jgi:ribosomal protein S18 acetylase RimI-like enzyme
MDITIRQGSIGEVVALSRQVPELTDPYGEAVYREKLAGKPHLILVACEGLFPVGFKVGYQREADGSFYSWMGGVLPDFRRRHAARLLAEAQEKWAAAQGYRRITCKTRNRHKAMLLFALKSGFRITAVEPQPDPDENRIWLEKALQAAEPMDRASSNALQ